MDRIKRLSIALLMAYAASMTLIAGQSACEARFYNRMFHLVTRQDDPPNPRPPYFGHMMMHALDFGLDRTRFEEWSIRIGDVRAPLIVPLIASFFAIGLARWPPRSPHEKD